MAKILVVDDEPGYRDPLQFILSEEGFEVEVAADGRRALDVAKRFVPDVLIVDWMLGSDMDGLEVAEALGAANPALRVIVISGYPHASLEARVASLPSARLLPKPFEISALLAAVHEAAGGAG